MRFGVEREPDPSAIERHQQETQSAFHRYVHSKHTARLGAYWMNDSEVEGAYLRHQASFGEYLNLLQENPRARVGLFIGRIRIPLPSVKVERLESV